MTIVFACPACGKTVSADAEAALVGTRGTCNLGSKSDACLIP